METENRPQKERENDSPAPRRVSVACALACGRELGARGDGPALHGASPQRHTEPIRGLLLVFLCALCALCGGIRLSGLSVVCFWFLPASRLEKF